MQRLSHRGNDLYALRELGQRREQRPNFIFDSASALRLLAVVPLILLSALRYVTVLQLFQTKSSMQTLRLVYLVEPYFQLLSPFTSAVSFPSICTTIAAAASERIGHDALLLRMHRLTLFETVQVVVLVCCISNDNNETSSQREKRQNYVRAYLYRYRDTDKRRNRWNNRFSSRRTHCYWPPILYNPYHSPLHRQPFELRFLLRFPQLSVFFAQRVESALSSLLFPLRNDIVKTSTRISAASDVQK